MIGRLGSLLASGLIICGGMVPASLTAGTTQRVSVGPAGVQGNRGSFYGVVSPDGRLVAFVSNASNLVPGDTNGWGDVFVRDRRSGSVQRVSVSSGGAQGNLSSFKPAITTDGNLVAFNSA